MRVIIAGCRHIRGEQARRLVVDAVHASGWIDEITSVVSGNASGIDRSGELWADRNQILVILFPAQWKTHGKAAGPIRNREMSAYADSAICVWDGQSRGTRSLIEEMKQRWSVGEAEAAVRVTVDAAEYLSRRRRDLKPRKLVLACQGVDDVQYVECVQAVLSYAEPDDTIGLGGWCILGWFRTWIPMFWQTARKVIPLIAAAGIASVHIFGVLFRPVLGGLLWLCDQHGIRLSTDSSAPLLATCFPDQNRSGALAPLWEDNVRLWKEALGDLPRSEYYREPPDPRISRQLDLWDAMETRL